MLNLFTKFVIDLIPENFFLQFRDSGVFIDQQEFNARHFRVDTQIFGIYRLTEHGVVCRTREDP